MSQYALGRLREVGRALNLFDDPVFEDRYTKLRLDVDALVQTYARYASALVETGTIGPEVSTLKIWGTETYQRISELLLESLDERGAELGALALPGGARVDAMSVFYNARPTTIYAGSNEIQRGILAKAVLKLPS